MNNGISIQNCTIQPVINEIIKSRRVIWDVLRLDRIHPQISGNKYFKLKYALSAAKSNQKTGLLTFGGAWSNHLLATAAMANLEGFKSVGLIRGEKPLVYSATLRDASELGMELRFLSRESYRQLSRVYQGEFEEEYPDYQYIPEGGYGEYGAKGAGEILMVHNTEDYDWIVTACGTGTTIAGLVFTAKPFQQLLGISVLKNHFDLRYDISSLLEDYTLIEKISFEDRFHFGGYAKHSPKLLAFMEKFFQDHAIPTDFVYTGKLMYAVNQLVNEGWFKCGSRILTIHSGGLQGNRSLKPGLLSF